MRTTRSYFTIDNNKLHDGLNIYEKKILSGWDQFGYKPDGFLHVTKEELHNYYYLGINLREVTLPINDPKFKFFQNNRRSNMIIVGKKYSLLNPDTYQKFNLDPKLNKDIVKLISNNNDIESLHLWKKNLLKFPYNEESIDTASRNGRIDILNWWLQSKLDIKYSTYAMDYAAIEGRIDVLNWWLKSKLELKYTDLAMNHALSTYDEKIIKWWIGSGLKYSKDKVKNYYNNLEIYENLVRTID